MLKIIIISLLTIIFIAVSFAQIIPPDTLWTQTFGGSGFDEGRSAVRTDDGGYVITGSYTLASVSIFLIKTDSNGVLQWEKTYGGIGEDKGHDVRQTLDGGYIITGYTTQGANSADIYLIKTNSSGDSLWTRTYGDALDQKAFSVRQTLDGGYIITRYTTDEVDGTDVYLMKTANLGNCLWDTSFGGSMNDYGYCVETTPDSGFIVVGSLFSFADSNEVYLAKFSASGVMNWDNIIGGAGADVGKSVYPTADGGYIITGYTSSGIADDPSDIYLIKTRSSGDTTWTKTFGGTEAEEGYAVVPTLEGGYIITGYTASGGTDSHQAIMISTDTWGNEIWTKYLGGLGNEGCYSIEQAEDGTYIAAGFTDSYGAGGSDAWMVRVNAHHDVLVELTPFNPPIIVPASGGNFTFDMTVTNNTAAVLNVDVWTQIHLPGQFAVPIITILETALPPGVPVVRTRVQNIPSFAPGGVYYYYIFTGAYPWVVENKDFFIFTKEGADGGIMGRQADWLCRGEPFPGENTIESLSPDNHLLLSAYPNPFNAETILTFNISEPGLINLSLFNTSGQSVLELADGYYSAGSHSIIFNGTDFSSGIYFAVLEARGGKTVQKLLLVK